MPCRTLQIGHMVNQSVEKLRYVKRVLSESGRTLKSNWEDAISSMTKEGIFEQEEGLFMSIKATGLQQCLY